MSCALLHSTPSLSTTAIRMGCAPRRTTTCRSTSACRARQPDALCPGRSGFSRELFGAPGPKGQSSRLKPLLQESKVTAMPASVLTLYRRITRWPAGHWLFSRAVCFKAPYFASIRPRIELLEPGRSEEHTSELQSLMRISYAVFCLKKKKRKHTQKSNTHIY